MFRWIALAVFVATLSISARRRWQARQATGTIPRTRETGALIAGRLFVAVPLFVSVAAYLANPRWMAWSSFALPQWAHWTGAVLGIAAVPFAFWVLTTIGSNVSETILTKERHQLVTAGPYRWVRHPLYLTGIALFASIGLMAANWFILLWTGIALAAVRLVVIPKEEANLIAIFGESYQTYRMETSALFPFPFPSRRP